MAETVYRNEWKHLITLSDMIAIRQRLRAIAKPDPHAIDGKYIIRSLYFDTPGDRALREKIDGVNVRDKFRLRYYNGDTGFIQLEKKSKRDGVGTKAQTSLMPIQAQAIIDGDIGWMKESGDALLIELYSRMRGENLRPKTLVDYTREPFVYGPGNVRVTLDYNIRTELFCTDFLNPDCVMIPAGDAGAPNIVLEVKWDTFLPSIIRSAVQVPGCRTAAFSKYEVCRIYG